MKQIAALSNFVLIVALLLVVEVHGSAIVNGRPSRPDEFPFMAALGWTNSVTGEKEYLCGGVLIDSDFVITAAHCVFLDGKLPDTIMIGGNFINSSMNEYRTVQAHFINPGYNSAQAYNDIALLQLNEKSWKRQAQFWNQTVTATSPTVMAIGYGTTQFAGLTSEVLQKVDLTVISEDECQQYFKRKRKFKSGVLPSHVCAGDPNGIGDTCQGDSGGPLLIYYIYVVGITSAGEACSGIPPAIYTRVSYFTDWIKDTISKAKLRL